MKNTSIKSIEKNAILKIIISSLFIAFILSQNYYFFSKINNKFISKYQNFLRISEETDPDNEPENEEEGEEEPDEIIDESFNSNVNKICSKASKEIKNYFSNYNKDEMDTSSQSLINMEIYPDYIEALLDIIEGDGKLKDNFFKYLKHAIAASFFLIMGIISVICWLCFSFFCCCNCCCCCCCKKIECKQKILFFSLLFDSIIIIVCLYGLITSNQMFSAFEDAECSFMKFVSEIDTGENRRENPKWVGFNKIIKIFNDIKTNTAEIKTQKETELNNAYNEYQLKKENFIQSLGDSYNYFVDKNDPFSPIIFDKDYCFQIIQENTIKTLDVGVLDILYNFGPVTNDEKFLYQLKEEYDTMTEKADNYLNDAYSRITHIFEENSIDIFVDEIKKNVKKIRKSMNDMKKKFVKYIVNYSDTIDKKGNYIVKICYISVICLSCLSGISLVSMFSTTAECCYKKFCFGKGLTKTLSHVSWNLMSITMILSFFICGVIFLVSSIGKDLIEVFSVILGQKNLSSRKPILLNTGVNNYFNVCLHGDGNLPEELGLYSEESSIFEFNELNKIINNIQAAKSDLHQIETVLNDYKNKIEERTDFKGVEIFDLNESYFLSLDNMIYTFNDLISREEGDMWTLNDTCSDTSYVYLECPEDEADIERKNVENEEEMTKDCLNFEEWKAGYDYRYKSPPVLILDGTYTTVLKAAKYFVDAVNNITEHIKNSNTIPDLEEKIGEVETAFNEAINSELDALEIFNSTIYDLFSIFDKYGDEDESLFSFLECNFMRDNILIVFKCLKKAFGGKVQAFGITFVFASFSMFFSIFFTILEIVILNVSLYLQKRRKEREEQLRISLGGERVTNYETTTSDKDSRIKLRKSKNSIK